MLQKVSYYFIYSKSILNCNVAIFLSFIINSICYKLGIWFFIHIPPYVKPPPKPISNSLSFNCILLLLMPSYHANGMDAADVLPYFLTLSKHLSIGILIPYKQLPVVCNWHYVVKSMLYHSMINNFCEREIVIHKTMFE